MHIFFHLSVQDCGQPGFTLAERHRFGTILAECVSHCVIILSIYVFIFCALVLKVHLLGQILFPKFIVTKSIGIIPSLC